jgi:hypothetical protein
MSHTAGASSTAGCQESGGELVELLAPALRERRASVVVEGSEGSRPGKHGAMGVTTVSLRCPSGVGSAPGHETEHERSREVDQVCVDGVVPN